MTKWGSPVLASNLHCCTPASRLQVLQRGRSCIPPPLTITSHYHLHLTDWAPAVSLAAATPAVVPQGPETSLTQLPGLVREGPLSRMGFDSHPGKCRLLTVASSLVVELGLSACRQWLQLEGSGAWALGVQGKPWTGLVVPLCMESSQTRDRTHVPCFGRHGESCPGKHCFRLSHSTRKSSLPLFSQLT